MKIEIKVLNKDFYKVNKMGGSYYDLPDYQTFGSAAVDLKVTEDVTLMPGERKMLPTGLAIWIGSAIHNSRNPLEVWGPVAGIILPRSGLGTKGLVLANTIGVIDEDYQGELMISAWNSIDISGGYNYPDIINLKAGDRIAQLMFIPIIKAQWEMVDEFSNKTKRGEGGFGSSGVR